VKTETRLLNRYSFLPPIAAVGLPLGHCLKLATLLPSSQN